MQKLIKYTLGPLWLFIGIGSLVVDGSWWGIAAIAAGVLFSLSGLDYYREQERKK